MKYTWSAAVVGLGQIGMGYDYDSADPDHALTHASAFAAHPRFDLAAGVDPDPDRRRAFTSKYGAPAHDNLASLEAGAPRLDLLAISVPTALHREVACDALERFQPGLILLEKPIAGQVDDAEEIIARARRAGCTLVVNYMRRFEPGARQVRTLLANGEIGEVYAGRIYYSAGLLNCGTHLVDLVQYWLGDAREIQMLDDGRMILADDFEPSFAFVAGGCRMVAMAARDEAFAMHEIELLGTAGILRYRRGGFRIELARRRADPHFPGEYSLSDEVMLIDNEMDRYQLHVVEALDELLSGRSGSASSTGETALATLRLAHEVIQRRKEYGGDHG